MKGFGKSSEQEASAALFPPSHQGISGGCCCRKQPWRCGAGAGGHCQAFILRHTEAWKSPEQPSPCCLCPQHHFHCAG